MQFARIGELVLHYQTIGAPEGRPALVFVNSLGTDFRIWRDVIVRLAGEASVLAYDKRGHGLSDAGTAPYRLDDHVADLAGLMDRLGLGQAVVCGASIGGMIAVRLAALRPDLVRGLAAFGSAARAGTAEMWDARIAAVEGEGIAAISDAVLERWFTPGFRAPENAAFAGWRNMLERQTATGYAGSCAAIRDADLSADAAAIGVPALFVAGEADVGTPPEAVRALSGMVPGAAFEIIDGAAHMMPVEAPERVAELIRGFAGGLG